MLGRATSCSNMPVTESLDGLPEIAEQVPPIGDLDGAGGTLADTIGISTGTIASDNLNAWAIAQPDGERRCLTIRQKVDDLVRLEVDQHGAVVAATSPCPVVDTENPRRRDGPDRQGSRRQAKQRVRARGNGDACCQASPSLAAERQAELVLKIAQPDGPTSGKTRHVCETLCERQAPAAVVDAVEPSRCEQDHDRPPLPRQILQLPLKELWMRRD